MRVLFISDVYFPRVNGVSTSIRTFRQDLANCGVATRLVAPRYEAVAPLTADGTGDLPDESGVLRLRDLAFESPIPLDQRIDRMGRLVLEFHREVVESWSHLPFLEDGYWERRDDEIDRDAWYVERVAAIQLASGGQGAEWLGLWTTARSLERIADHAVVLGEVGRYLGDLPSGDGPVTSLRQFHRQAMEHLEGVLNASDGRSANDLLDLGDALQASGRALFDRLLPAVGGGTMAPATAAAVTRILESIGRTVAYAQDIAQVALDRNPPLAAAGRYTSVRPVAVARALPL